MSIFTQKSRILITCPKGLPPFVKAELLTLGFPIKAERVAGVETEGTLGETMRLNLYLRTGHRVLFRLAEFTARHPEELYTNLSQIAWEEYISAESYLSVLSAVDTPTITDSRFANMKCKDAIVDRLRRRYGRRPNSGPLRSGVVVFLYWKDQYCSVYLDTSGEPLAKRGYRKIPLQAPMQETLAAAVVLATGWNGNDHFLNPMCGSGTLAIEAALIGLQKAPGLLRSHFAFMRLKGFPEEEWKMLRKQAKEAATKSLLGKIVATDIREEAITAARKNAMTAGVDHLIEFQVCPYAQTPLPAGSGVVVLNPEYGERVGQLSTLPALYKGIGDYLKQRCTGYRGYLFTGNLPLAQNVGLKPRRRIPFFNGQIECRLLEYELYAGSKKQRSTARKSLHFTPDHTPTKK